MVLDVQRGGTTVQSSVEGVVGGASELGCAYINVGVCCLEGGVCGGGRGCVGGSGGSCLTRSIQMANLTGESEDAVRGEVKKEINGFPHHGDNDIAQSDGSWDSIEHALKQAVALLVECGFSHESIHGDVVVGDIEAIVRSIGGVGGGHKRSTGHPFTSEILID